MALSSEAKKETLVQEQMAMKRWIGTTFLLKLSLVVSFTANVLPAQQASKAIHIAVDMREAPNRIYHAKLEFPVAAGPLTLVYPKWIPGEHRPNGPIVDVAGLKFYAGGKEIPWLRDDVDMFAFHCNIPPSTNTLEVMLDYLAPGTTSTAKLGILNWNLVLLYPLGPKSDDLTFVATLKIPQGWKYATAEILREAIRHAKNGNEPIELLFENVEYLRSYRVDYHGGERYPHLERIEGKPDVLAEIANMRAPVVTAGTD